MTTEEFENIIRLFNSKDEKSIELGLQICKGLKWSFASDLIVDDVLDIIIASRLYYLHKNGEYALFWAFIKKMKFGAVSPKEWTYFKLYTNYNKPQRLYEQCTPRFSLPKEQDILTNFLTNFSYGVMFGASKIHVRFDYSLFYHYKNSLDYAMKTIVLPKNLKLEPMTTSEIPNNTFFSELDNRGILSKI